MNRHHKQRFHQSSSKTNILTSSALLYPISQHIVGYIQYSQDYGTPHPTQTDNSGIQFKTKSNWLHPPL